MPPYPPQYPPQCPPLSWNVTGARGSCSDGTTGKCGARTSPTAYQVGVQVTNWHQYTITGVRVSYSYKVRI